MKLTKKDVKRIKKEILRDIDTIPHNEVLPKIEMLYKNDPKDVMVLNSLIHIFYHKKDFTKARHYIKQVLNEDPNDSQALKYKAWVCDETGDKKQYIETLEQIIKSGNADWEVNDQYAELNEKYGHYPRALGSYTLALKDPNNNQPLHAAIGGANCYSKSGAYGIADEIYDTLLDTYPGDLLILHNKANCLYLKGELDEAEKILQGIISKDPQYEISKHLINDIEVKRVEVGLLKNIPKDDFEEELKSSNVLNNYDEDFDHESMSPEAMDALVCKLKELEAKGNYQEAKNMLETALKIDNSNPAVLLYLANLHYQLIEMPEAIDCCNKVLSFMDDVDDYKPVGTLKIKAEALFALGKLDEALATTKKLISMDPTNYIPIINKARILNRMGDYRGALNILLPIMSIIPLETEVLGFANYLLATAYNKLGNDPEYIKALYEAFRLGCEFGTRWFRIKYVAIQGTLGDLYNNNKQHQSYGQ